MRWHAYIHTPLHLALGSAMSSMHIRVLQQKCAGLLSYWAGMVLAVLVIAMPSTHASCPRCAAVLLAMPSKQLTLPQQLRLRQSTQWQQQLS
jgi:hypothetical protein